MKLPFVSRELYDAALSAERHRADEWASRYAVLLERYHRLKLHGFTDAQPAEPIAPRPAPDAVTRAILAACGTNRALRAQMERQAALDRAMGASDDAIVAQIRAGVTPDETFSVAGV